MKIKVIMPDKIMDRKTLVAREVMLSQALSHGTEISVDCVKKGPDELDCYTDEAFAAAEMVKESIKAEKEGYDAIVIYCFSDVGLDAIRENVRIPVIGPEQASLAAANTLCNRFTVITTESSNIPRTYRRLMKNCIAREKMTSVRALDMPIGDVRKDQNATVGYLMDVCKKAFDEEHIDGVILGCLSMAGYGGRIESQLPVKVIDPAFIAVAYAEMCSRLNLTHIPGSYPPFKNVSHVDL